MKPNDNIPRGRQAIDAEISAFLDKELAKANSNPWFTPA